MSKVRGDHMGDLQPATTEDIVEAVVALHSRGSAMICTTDGCAQVAVRLVTCEGVSSYPYCVDCVDALLQGGEIDRGPVPETNGHDAYAHPLDGGERGYQATCRDCSWTGLEHDGRDPLAKDRAREDAIAHEADPTVEPILVTVTIAASHAWDLHALLLAKARVRAPGREDAGADAFRLAAGRLAEQL